MKPQAIGSACSRVQGALDEALATGTLSLPAELAAHAARCPRCAPELNETEHLLARLRDAAAGVNLGRVPHVVDSVLAGVVNQPGPAPRPESAAQRAPAKRVRVQWVLGQVAAVAAVLLIALGGLGFVLLKVNQAIGGVRPGEVMARLVAPFSQTDEAEVHKAK